MLISFTFKNWRSFRDETTFTMLATGEKQHANHLARVPSYDRGRSRFELLPLAVMYGGNASGKSNFAKALSFVKKMVVMGGNSDEQMGVEPFRFESSVPGRPSSFVVRFLIDETVYCYEFSLTSERIEREKLSVLTKTGVDKLLFQRNGDEFVFKPALKGDRSYLNALSRGVPERKLLLFHANQQREKNDTLHSVFIKFAALYIFYPDMKFSLADELLDESSWYFNKLNEVIPVFDTGIIKIRGKLAPIEGHKLFDSLNQFLKDAVKTAYYSSPSGIVYCKNIEGQWHYVKMVAYHERADGGLEEVNFDLESDGSQRLCDLLPFFTCAFGMNSVVIIDEIDRSLHPLLTRKLLETYLANRTPESRNQLILTTHDAMLLDQDLLRRDEIWVAERDETGASKIYSFSEFKDVRADKDIRKSYLQGRMGGVPKLGMTGVFCRPETGSAHE